MDQNNQNEIVIVPGSDVVGTDGDKIGTVKEVFPDYIIVEKGWFFPSDHYIPAVAISDANENTVFLNVTKDDALSKGWDEPPATTPAGSAGTVTDTGQVMNDSTAGDYVTENRVDADTGNNAFAPIDNAENNATAGDPGAPGSFADEGVTVDRVGSAAGTTAHDRPSDRTTDVGADHLDQNGTMRVPLAEEELTATKRPVESGGVRVTKDVEESQQTLDVPVREEHLNVERRVVDREVAPDETLFQEGTIDVPIRSEEVDVQKRARIAEEVEISRDSTERTQQVSDTVRRERAHVEDLSGTATDRVRSSSSNGNGADSLNGTDENDEGLIEKAKDKVEGMKNRDRR